FCHKKNIRGYIKLLKIKVGLKLSRNSFFNSKCKRKEVYVCQPLGFEDPDHLDKVYKVVKALYGLHQAPRAWYETLANYLLENSFQRGKINQTLFIKRQKGDILLVQIYGLQVKQKKDGIFISQDKYVAEILRKFGLTEEKSASTPIDTEKPRLKDPDVCACARFQVTAKDSPLGLWYPKDSPFDLVAYSDSDYAGASLDRKSTTGGCQFLGCRLIAWQCKKQTVVATSSTEAGYVAAISCCSQVLWIQCNCWITIKINVVQRYTLKRLLHVTNILTAGYLTTPEMVLNSPCLTNMKNWLVQIKRSLFWTTVTVKKVNDVMRFQALVDRKKVAVTEAMIREALRLDDAEGVECLLNEEIFAKLARMGHEKPSTKLTYYKAFFISQWKFLIHTILQYMRAKQTLWNEFSSSMAYAIICLSSGRKFNFSKVGKGFFGVKTSLFEAMLVAHKVSKGVADEEHDEGVPAGGVVTEGDVSAAHDEVHTADEEPSIPSLIPPTLPPKPSHDIPSTS
nr:hypothetical protein [Tanacetum cinerariifolium]